MRPNNVFLISLSSTLRVMGFSPAWIFTAIYMHTVLHTELYIVGIVYTIGGALSAIVQVYSGRLGDRFGYRRIILLFFLISSVFFSFLYAAATLRIPEIPFSILFVSSMVVNSVSRPSTNALISLSSKTALGGFSSLRVGANIGWGIGPAIGGLIISLFGYHTVYLLSLANFLIAAVISYFLVEIRGEVTEKQKIRLTDVDHRLILLGIISLLLFIVQAQESVTLSNFATVFRGLSAGMIGIIYFANGVFVVIFQIPAYRITSKIGLSKGFIIGGLIYSIGYFTMSLDYTLLEFVLSMVFLTLGEDFAFPIGLALASKLTGRRNVGANMGIYNAFISFGRSLGPVMGGFALSYVSSSTLLWAIVTLPGFFAVMIFASGVSKDIRRLR